MTGRHVPTVAVKRRHMGTYASCGCGWNALASSQQEATQRGLEHVVVETARAARHTGSCSCYDPIAAEWAPDKCARCVLNDALDALDLHIRTYSPAQMKGRTA